MKVTNIIKNIKEIRTITYVNSVGQLIDHDLTRPIPNGYELVIGYRRKYKKKITNQ